jgi:hypothetical protein
MGLGDKEKAFDFLEQAYLQRSGSLVLLKIDQRFESIRSDPRYKQLVEKIAARAG